MGWKIHHTNSRTNGVELSGMIPIIYYYLTGFTGLLGLFCDPIYLFE